MRLLFTALACLISMSMFGQFNIEQIINVANMTEIDQEIYFLTNGYEYSKSGKSFSKTGTFGNPFPIINYSYSPLDEIEQFHPQIRTTSDSLGVYSVFYNGTGRDNLGIDTIGVLMDYDGGVINLAPGEFKVQRSFLCLRNENRFDDFLGQIYYDLKTLNFILIDQISDTSDNDYLIISKEYRRRSTPYNFDTAKYPNSDGVEYISIGYLRSNSGESTLFLEYHKVTFDFLKE